MHTAVPAHAAHPGGNGVVAYSTNREDTGSLDYRLYQVSSDGGGKTGVGAQAVVGYEPAWSPDGSRIAYVRDASIWVVDADGSDERQLTQGQGGSVDSAPSWSPDGTRIVFHRVVDLEVEQLYVVGAAGGQAPTQLTFPEPAAGRDGAREPAWGPDGRIAYINLDLEQVGGTFSFEHEVAIIGADGSGFRILPGTGSAQHPDWSPDGSRIVFSVLLVTPDTNWELFVVDVGGGMPVNVSNTPQLSERQAVWSPDGPQFAYGARDQSESIQDTDVYVMPSGDGPATNLSMDDGQNFDEVLDVDPAWQPVGGSTPPA